MCLANVVMPIALQPIFILQRIGHSDGSVIPGMFLAVLLSFLLIFAMNIWGAAKHTSLRPWFFGFASANTAVFVLISHISLLTALPDIPFLIQQGALLLSQG